MFTLLLFSITSSVVLLFWKYVISRKQHRPYPPGPNPKPIIGNFFDLPTKDLANVYLEWGRKYNSDLNSFFFVLYFRWHLAIGSIIHASAFGNHVVVVNKLEDAAELLDRRAPKYSDRPEYPILKLCVNTGSAIKYYLTLRVCRMGWDHNIALMRYGESWFYRRKIAHQNFRKEAVKNYHNVLLEKVYCMLDGLLKNPEQFDQHNRMYATSNFHLMHSDYWLFFNTGYLSQFQWKQCMDTTWCLSMIHSLPVPIKVSPWGSNFSYRMHPWSICSLCLPSSLPGFQGHRLPSFLRKSNDWRMKFSKLPWIGLKWAWCVNSEFSFPESWPSRWSQSEGTAVPSVFTELLERKNTVGASVQEEAAIADIAYTAYGGKPPLHTYNPSWLNTN